MNPALLLAVAVTAGAIYKLYPVADPPVIDLLELNHLYDGYSGKVSFDQIIAYRWEPDLAQFRVAQWWLANDPDTQTPIKNHQTGLYEARVRNDKHLLTVKSWLFKESWTHIDPEREQFTRFRGYTRVPVFLPANP